MDDAELPAPDSPSGQAMTPPELVTAVYAELRRLAAGRMARESGPQTLQATALVHEAWLRLGGEQQPDWANRAQFFAAAAEAMRRILVERARRRQAIRHGGGQERVDFEALNWEHADATTMAQNDVQVIRLHEALERLAAEDPEVAEIVKLRYFGGASISEAARSLGLAERTAERRLQFARAWLGRELQAEDL